MKKLIQITGALIISTLLSMNAYAANLSFGTEISFNETEYYTEDYLGVWGEMTGTDLSALPQFDPLLGTLNSVTLTIFGDLAHGTNIMPFGTVIDESQPHSMSARGNVSITVSGPGDISLWQTFTNSAECTGTGDFPCETFNAPDTFDTVDIGGTYTEGDPEFGTFVGDGDLSDIWVSFLFAMDDEPLWNPVNLDSPEAEMIADFGDSGFAVAVVSYEFTPVPVPGAFLLLGFGLISIMGLQRRRQ